MDWLQAGPDAVALPVNGWATNHQPGDGFQLLLLFGYPEMDTCRDLMDYQCFSFFDYILILWLKAHYLILTSLFALFIFNIIWESFCPPLIPKSNVLIGKGIVISFSSNALLIALTALLLIAK